MGGLGSGQGLGLDVHEPPSVVDTDETELPPGAVISVESGICIPGKFGIRIEDSVLVGSGWPGRLTSGPAALLASLFSR